jgi:glucose/arabinose dehydrogenase
MSRILVTAALLFALPFTAAQAQFGGGPSHQFRVVTVAEGFQNPWSMAWLPNGDMLVTERGGTIRTVRDGRVLPEPMANVPAVKASGQGGLFDIVLHPDYESNGWVYISFAKPDADNVEAATTVIRARIRNNALVDIEEIFEADAWSNSAGHYGGRIAFDGNGHVFISSGERMAPSVPPLDQHPAQQTDNHFGVIVRLNDDGSVPDDNPFVGRAGFAPEIWSYGHRNPQGLAYDSATGRLWETEHAPQGGDELNLIEPRNNYGWPVIGYGANYGSGTEIHPSRYKEGMTQPAAYWVPSPALSGLMIYHGNQFPNWDGQLFAGGLSADHSRISRLTVNAETGVVSGRTPMLMQQYRIRDVREGPDGYIYIATDSRGTTQTTPIIRLEPVE